MSLKTWKEEFYPVTPRKSMTKRQAIEHSLRKWQGLTKANLKKHKVIGIGDYGWIRDEELDEEYEYEVAYMEIDHETCALCVKYLDQEAPNETIACGKCPLSKYLGKPCDSDDKSPYMIWRDTDNPRPMIKALQKILEEL